MVGKASQEFPFSKGVFDSSRAIFLMSFLRSSDKVCFSVRFPLFDSAQTREIHNGGKLFWGVFSMGVLLPHVGPA